MEAASIPETPTGAPSRNPVAAWLTDNILWVLLGLALVYFFAQDPKQTLDDIKTGLSNGTIWALVAIGYTLVYGIIELINFAHGEVFMIGSFVSVSLFATLGLTSATGAGGLILGLLATLVVAMVACGTLNVLLEKVGYRPLRAAPKLAPLITAVGFSFILQNVGLLWRGGSPQSIDDLIDSQHVLVTIFGVPIQRGYILAFAVMITLVFALGWFINSTHAGRAM